MANRRQSSFFRLPWLTASVVHRPTQPRNPRATTGNQTTAEQTAYVPPQKPPFRPTGLAPTQSPPSQSPRPKPGSQAPSLSRDAREKVDSRPSSPYLAANGVQTPALRQSPSQTQKKSRAALLPSSPSTVSSQSERNSLPSSPSPAASQSGTSIQSEQTRSSSRLLSPSKKLEQTPQASPLLSPSSGIHPSASPQEKQEPALLEGSASDSESPSKTSSLPKSSEHQPISNSEEKHERTYELIEDVQEEHRREENKQPIYKEQKRIITMHESFEGSSGKLLGSPHQKDRSTGSEALQKPAKPNGGDVNLHEGINEDISKFIHKMESGLNQTINDKPVSVITLAGDNRGASMQLDSEPSKKERSVHINRGYKVNPDDSAEATTNGEGISKRSKSRNPITEEDQGRTVVNSNIQGINNSMVFNSSVTERDPGIHLSRGPAEPAKIKGERESPGSHKAEVNVTPAEKYTYEPRVRRRCLRGLFMEPNDFEPDNPEKPQRHGCRYNCVVKNKDKDMGIF